MTPSACRSLPGAQSAASRGTLDIVLSNHFVRYCLVPWDAKIANAAELRSYALACFENVFGDVSAAWEVCISPEKSNAPHITNNIDNKIKRFLRTVKYKNVQKSLLPNAIADGNPDQLWRRVDGQITQN